MQYKTYIKISGSCSCSCEAPCCVAVVPAAQTAAAGRGGPVRTRRLMRLLLRGSTGEGPDDAHPH